ncbi:hypothetical protein ACJJVG_08830 [Pseudocitrobacter faecalis]|uniref:hypothetical protein n=1 Tax=Pseudocitrobacter faecalis TaxID=1398493 RepID=UPI00389A7A33
MQQVKTTFTNHHGKVIREDVQEYEIKNKRPVLMYAGLLLLTVVMGSFIIEAAYKCLAGA